MRVLAEMRLRCVPVISVSHSLQTSLVLTFKRLRSTPGFYKKRVLNVDARTCRMLIISISG